MHLVLKKNVCWAEVFHLTLSTFILMKYAFERRGCIILLSGTF